MDYNKVLKRSWHMVTRYRALWIFGIVLGIVTFSWNMVFFGGWDDDNQVPRGIVITRLDGETFSDAFHRTLQAELDEVEAEVASARVELDELFAI